MMAIEPGLMPSQRTKVYKVLAGTLEESELCLDACCSMVYLHRYPIDLAMAKKCNI